MKLQVVYNFHENDRGRRKMFDGLEKFEIQI